MKREWVKRLMVAFAILFGSIAILLVSTPAHATHPAGGTCKHTHDAVDDTYSVCKKGTLGKKCERDGAEGRCSSSFGGTVKVDRRTGTLSSVGAEFTCNCIRVKDETQAAQIARASAATTAAANFTGVASALGSNTAACTQLNNLLIEILRAISGVVGYGPVEIFSADLLNQIDQVIKGFPTSHSTATSTCGLSPPPLASVMTALEGIKNQISASRISKEPS
jgi:hypothetical protein